MVAPMEVMRALKWILSILLGGAILAASSTSFAQSDWKGMSRMETANPRFERRSTLRVVRSNGSLDDTLNDQKSMLGFGAAVATGTVEPLQKPGTTEGLEILKKGEIVVEED